MLKNFTQCKLYSNINKRNLINMHISTVFKIIYVSCIEIKNASIIIRPRL